MFKIILGTLTVSGVIIGASSIASASPSSPVLNPKATVTTANIEHVDYYYNHHHYKHRSWDKHHNRWHYY
jgi:hypothetical protein